MPCSLWRDYKDQTVLNYGIGERKMVKRMFMKCNKYGTVFFFNIGVFRRERFSRIYEKQK